MSEIKEKIILKVKKENLIQWYFDNWDRHDLILLLSRIKKNILLSDEFILRIENIADGLGYIPTNILEGEHDVDEYEFWDELILI